MPTRSTGDTMRRTALVLVILAGCITEPEITNEPSYATSDSVAAESGITVTIANPVPHRTPSCTLVLTSKLTGVVTRIGNWSGMPALEPLAPSWDFTFEDCPDTHDPATGMAHG